LVVLREGSAGILSRDFDLNITPNLASVAVGE